MRTGVELLKARAAERGVMLPPDDVWPAELFAELGLPIVVQCSDCTETLAMPSAKVDARGHTYCDDCAERRYPDGPRHKFTVEIELSDRELLAINHDTTLAGSIANAATVASHVRVVVEADLEERIEAMRLAELEDNEPEDDNDDG